MTARASTGIPMDTLYVQNVLVRRQKCSLCNEFVYISGFQFPASRVWQGSQHHPVGLGSNVGPSAIPDETPVTTV